MSSEAPSSSAKCSGARREAACECKAGVGRGLLKVKHQPDARGATSHLGRPATRRDPVTVGTISATMPNRAASEPAGPGPGGRGEPLPGRADSLSRLASRFAGRSETAPPQPVSPRGTVRGGRPQGARPDLRPQEPWAAAVQGAGEKGGRADRPGSGRSVHSQPEGPPAGLGGRPHPRHPALGEAGRAGPPSRSRARPGVIRQ
jgi:hypothetical protein